MYRIDRDGGGSKTRLSCAIRSHMGPPNTHAFVLVRVFLRAAGVRPPAGPSVIDWTAVARPGERGAAAFACSMRAPAGIFGIVE